VVFFGDPVNGDVSTTVFFGDPVNGDSAISPLEQGFPILLERGMIPPGKGDVGLLTGRETTV
jgi:hypothetical protein